MVLRGLLMSTAVLCSGCGNESGPGKPATTAGGRQQVVSNGGNWQVGLQMSPDPVPMNQPFSVSFSVSPKAGSKPPPQGSDLSVEVDARMPAHGHGMNVAPKVSRAADGTWRAEGMLFHMPGHWEMYFDITSGGKTERAQVDVHLK